jgi:hypothetical protein
MNIDADEHPKIRNGVQNGNVGLNPMSVSGVQQ